VNGWQTETPTSSFLYNVHVSYYERKGILMRRIYISLLALIVISTLSACGNGPSVLNVSFTSKCQSATGQSSTCTVTLTNASSSTGDFNWTASSTVGGVEFNPSSGTVSPGASSDPVKATIPAGECPFRLTFANSGGTSLNVDYQC